MSRTKEIITVQIGHYANFVGTHWWNIQESSFCYEPNSSSFKQINHDVLYREGENSKKEVTYTPRLLAIDLKGSLQTLQKEGTLYASPHRNDENVLWSGKVDVHKTAPSRKNEFLEDLEKLEQYTYPDLYNRRTNHDEDKDVCQVERRNSLSEASSSADLLAKKCYNLDDKVEVWSDFLRIHHHPRSVFLVEDYIHHDEHNPFDLFGCGIQSYSSEKMKDGIEDRIRILAEECDLIQGFHMLLDINNGFAGVAKCVLQHLEDEYMNKIKLCFPVYHHLYNIEQKQARTAEVLSLFSTLFCLDSLNSYSSLFCPLSTSKDLFSTESLSFPYLEYNKSLPYHTSAILASALETVTLPTRLKSNEMQLNEVVANLVYVGRKLAVVSAAVPFPMNKEFCLANSVNTKDALSSTIQSLTPMCHLRNHKIVVQSLISQGIHKSRIYSAQYPRETCSSPENLLGQYVQQWCPSSVSLVKMIDQPQKVMPPFPNIFTNDVSQQGILNEIRPPNTGVENIPILSGLHNSDGAAELIGGLIEKASKINFRKFHRCLETGIESDDIAEVAQALNNFVNCYNNYDT